MTQSWNIIESVHFEEFLGILDIFGTFGHFTTFWEKIFFGHFQAFIMLELLAKKLDKTNDSILKYYRKSPFWGCFMHFRPF